MTNSEILTQTAQQHGVIITITEDAYVLAKGDHYQMIHPMRFAGMSEQQVITAVRAFALDADSGEF